VTSFLKIVCDLVQTVRTVQKRSQDARKRQGENIFQLIKLPAFMRTTASGGRLCRERALLLHNLHGSLYIRNSP